MKFSSSSRRTAPCGPAYHSDHTRTPARSWKPISVTQSQAGSPLLRAGSGDAVAAQLSLVKVAIGRSAVTAVQTAVAAMGNPGLSRRQPFERHLRDVLCVRVHPPQDDAALLAAGRRLLAPPRDDTT